MKRSAQALDYLEHELALLAQEGLLRGRPPPRRRGDASYCSNDYLGLAFGPDAEPAYGAGASRLVSGEHAEHAALEAALGRWLQVESALLFTSGYAANVGIIPALASSASDEVLSDALNHASIVDGCRLSRARTTVYPHLDVAAVRSLLERRSTAGRRWVVTESYFSMDADSPDLRALRAACDDHGAALIVDEAHAVGVLGPEGRGLCAAAGVVPDVLVGTMGKALGAGGAFVAGSEALVAWLWNRARSFVFSTGLSPAIAEAARGALERAMRDTALRGRVAERAAELRAGLERLGLSPLGYGHVVPLVLGESAEAVRVAEHLQSRGFAVRAIRPPTVQAGTARIRFTATAAQSSEDVRRLIAALAECFT